MSSRTIRLVIPAEADHVPLLRTTVAAVAGRRQFTLEEVDDLRMGVEEAAVLLLRRTTGESISLELTLVDHRIEATISALTGEEPVVDQESFSWMILSALADDVTADQHDGTARIVLKKQPTQSLAT